MARRITAVAKDAERSHRNDRVSTRQRQFLSQFTTQQHRLAAQHQLQRPTRGLNSALLLSHCTPLVIGVA